GEIRNVGDEHRGETVSLDLQCLKPSARLAKRIAVDSERPYHERFGLVAARSVLERRRPRLRIDVALQTQPAPEAPDRDTSSAIKTEILRRREHQPVALAKPVPVRRANEPAEASPQQRYFVFD